MSSAASLASSSAAIDRFVVGDACILRVEESCFDALDPYEIYPDVRPEHLADNLSWLVPGFLHPASGRLVVSFQSFIVQADGKTIVVDTCVGDCKHRARPAFDRQAWGWLDRLRSASIEPEDVDIVVCTHFHVDHVGWNTRLDGDRWVPTFPRATYLFPQNELDYWGSAAGARAMARTGDYWADSIAPILEADLARAIRPGHIVSPSVAVREAHGHTPGSVAVEVQSRGQRALLIGDVAHTLLQLRYPDWNTRFCTNPEAARETRLRILEEAARTQTLLLPNHFVAPTAGLVEQGAGGFSYRYVGSARPVFELR